MSSQALTPCVLVRGARPRKHAERSDRFKATGDAVGGAGLAPSGHTGTAAPSVTAASVIVRERQPVGAPKAPSALVRAPAPAGAALAPEAVDSSASTDADDNSDEDEEADEVVEDDEDAEDYEDEDDPDVLPSSERRRVLEEYRRELSPYVRVWSTVSGLVTVHTARYVQRVRGVAVVDAVARAGDGVDAPVDGIDRFSAAELRHDLLQRQLLTACVARPFVRAPRHVLTSAFGRSWGPSTVHSAQAGTVSGPAGRECGTGRAGPRARAHVLRARQRARAGTA